jgi:hypothetical protein
MAAFICSEPSRDKKSLSVNVIIPSQAVETIIGRAMANISATPPLPGFRLNKLFKTDFDFQLTKIEAFPDLPQG